MMALPLVVAIMAHLCVHASQAQIMWTLTHDVTSRGSLSHEGVNKIAPAH